MYWNRTTENSPPHPFGQGLQVELMPLQLLWCARKCIPLLEAVSWHHSVTVRSAWKVPITRASEKPLPLPPLANILCFIPLPLGSSPSLPFIYVLRLVIVFHVALVFLWVFLHGVRMRRGHNSVFGREKMYCRESQWVTNCSLAESRCWAEQNLDLFDTAACKHYLKIKFLLSIRSSQKWYLSVAAM